MCIIGMARCCRALQVYWFWFFLFVLGDLVLIEGQAGGSIVGITPGAALGGGGSIVGISPGNMP